MVNCCIQHVFAWFKRERLAEFGLRHTGRSCAGRVDKMVFAPWFYRGQVMLTGERMEVPRDQNVV